MSDVKRILFFSKSAGFEHDTIKRGDAEWAPVELFMAQFGPANGYEVVCSKDGSLFSPEYLAGFDAYLFCTTGNLETVGTDGQPAFGEGGKQALLDAVAGGKGFVGVHNASDTFHGPDNTVDAYTAMLGGQFLTHGAQQDAKQVVVDPKFPGLEGLPAEFTTHDEWYVQKNVAADIHPIVNQLTEGMTGEMYETREAYASVWARQHGDGRVFYIANGHRPDNWEAAEFKTLLLAGLNWVTGRTNADL